jgi:hypothetical protein
MSPPEVGVGSAGSCCQVESPHREVPREGCRRFPPLDFVQLHVPVGLAVVGRLASNCVLRLVGSFAQDC